MWFSFFSSNGSTTLSVKSSNRSTAVPHKTAWLPLQTHGTAALRMHVVLSHAAPYTVFNQLSTSAYKSGSEAAFFTLGWRDDIVLRGVRSNRGVVQRARWPYRRVEVALAVHGDVEPRLGALDGHYSESHRNQVELHCKKKRGTAGVSEWLWCYLLFRCSQSLLAA